MAKIIGQVHECPVSAENRDSSSREAALSQATARVKEAVDSVAQAIKNHADVSDPRQEFTIASRSLAKIVMAEQIRQTCLRLLPESQPSELFDSLEKKFEFAETIRGWLVPWNLGFRDQKTGELYQLFAKASGNKAGVFHLCKCGSTVQRIMEWSRILEIISNPQLDDIPPTPSKHPRIAGDSDPENARL